MNGLRRIHSDGRNRFINTYNKYNISSNEFENRFEYSKNCSPDELLVAIDQFKALLRLLFENKPHVYLEMSLDSLLCIKGNPRCYIRGHDTDIIKEIYSSYALKYSNLLKKFLQDNPLDRSPKDFLVDSFINDHIYNLCKNGTYRVNLLSLDYTSIHRESEAYFRERLFVANNMFSGKGDINNCSSWQANYNDKLFDVSLLTTRDILELCYLTKYKIDDINKLFRSTLRKDRLE